MSKKLLLHIQPDLVPELDVQAVISAAESMVRESDVSEPIRVMPGEEGDVEFINIGFESEDVGRLWRLVWKTLYIDRDSQLARASMAMCEGEDGWTDYDQLHHMDPSVHRVPLEGVGFPMVKLGIRHRDGVETPWAYDLGGEYMLDNIPFFAYGLSLWDVVLAEAASDGLLECTEVIRKSGNRTVRIVFAQGVDVSSAEAAVLGAIADLGCTYAGASPRYICVNVPAEVDLEMLGYQLTTAGCDWEHADPSRDELFPEN